MDVPLHTSDHEVGAVSRRGLLKGAGLGAVALGGATLLGTGTALLGGTPAQAAPSYPEINNYPTYEENLDTGGVRSFSFQYEANFYQKLEEWASWFFLNTPWYVQAPVKIYLNGTYVNKPGPHGQARAADLSGFVTWNAIYGTEFRALDGRFDKWRNDPVHPAEIKRWYWAGICSLNVYFRDVLHYFHRDDNGYLDHENHIHVDNSKSYGTYSSFTTGSNTQVETVQATCNYIFNMGTSIDGVWGDQTRTHSSSVLAMSGGSGRITDSQANWHRFLRTGFRGGWGLSLAGT